MTWRRVIHSEFSTDLLQVLLSAKKKPLFCKRYDLGSLPFVYFSVTRCSPEDIYFGTNDHSLEYFGRCLSKCMYNPRCSHKT